MAESQGKGLKTPVNGLFHKNFEFEPLFGYDNFQNKIDTWETTVPYLGFQQRVPGHGIQEPPGPLRRIHAGQSPPERIGADRVQGD